MNKKRLIVAIAILIILAGAFVLAATRTTSPNTRMQVTATFYPLYDFAKQVGGNKIDVTNITPAGTEPHEYEPTPRQLVGAQKSGVFIYNGATMESWVQKFLPEYKGQAVMGGAGLELKGDDPHYWLDPVMAQKTVNNIRDGLGKADPVNAQYYTQQAAAYNAKLEKLHADITAGLRNCQQHTVITSHNAFAYFGARYNLKVVPIAGLSPEQEPSPAKLAELSDLIKKESIGYVFFESLVSTKLAETLAAETGAQTAVFDTIEGITNEEQQKGTDYISVQRQNLAALRTALSCQ
ncbi:MAG TPA: zinc ABC transporter substrate-binding protein [Candidatus Saccharimonadales bacterium]|nr:zinc ABC transporter substrate-binding protein [Candidatus Saccharimonadales bacterium]